MNSFKRDLEVKAIIHMRSGKRDKLAKKKDKLCRDYISLGDQFGVQNVASKTRHKKGKKKIS